MNYLANSFNFEIILNLICITIFFLFFLITSIINALSNYLIPEFLNLYFIFLKYVY